MHAYMQSHESNIWTYIYLIFYVMYIQTYKYVSMYLNRAKKICQNIWTF